MTMIYPYNLDPVWLLRNAGVPIVLMRMMPATEANTVWLGTVMRNGVGNGVGGGETLDNQVEPQWRTTHHGAETSPYLQSAILPSRSVVGTPPSDEEAAANVVEFLTRVNQANYEPPTHIRPPMRIGHDLWSVQLSDDTEHVMVIPHNLPEGSEWWIQLVDSQWHRIRIPRELQVPQPPFAMTPTSLSPTSFASSGPPTPESFVAQDAPVYAGGDIATNDADAFIALPEDNFQPVARAAPAPRHNNFHISGNAHSMPYPAEKPQAAAPRAGLMAHNNKSTGATLMGGALAGDAGGMVSSHTKAAQATASPASSTSSQPEHIWTGIDAGPAPKLLCPYENCVCPRAGGHWRGRPFFTGRQRYTDHLRTHNPSAKRKPCPGGCGNTYTRIDAANRHLPKCTGPPNP